MTDGEALQSRSMPIIFLGGWLWLALPSAVSIIHGTSPVAVILDSGRNPSAKILWFATGIIPIVIAYPGTAVAVARWSRSARWMYHLTYAMLAAGSLPLLSHDMLSYIAQSRMVADLHANPLIESIRQVPHWRDHYWLRRAGWAGRVAPYGPFWSWWINLSAHLTRPFWSEYLWLKGTNLGAVGLAALALRKLRDRQAAYRFWFHPLVGIELLFNGHNDALMIACMLLGYLQYQRQQYWRFAVSWAVAVGIKFIPLVVLPILLVGIDPVVTVGILAVGLSVLSIGYAPYWQGPSTLSAPLANQTLFLRSLGFVVQGALSHLGHFRRSQSRHQATVISMGTFVMVGAWLAAKARQREWQTLIVADVLLALALVGMTWFQYWYLLWGLPFYILSRHRTAPQMVQWLSWSEIFRLAAWPQQLNLAEREVMQWLVIWSSLLVLRIWSYRHGRRTAWFEPKEEPS